MSAAEPTPDRPGASRAAVAGGIGRAPGVDRRPPHTRSASGSSQVAPRHPRAIAYRCFLPDLTGFTGLRCVGPDSQRRSPLVGGGGRRPRPGVQPRCSGLRVQGTASSPPSTTAAMVRGASASVNSGGGGEGGIRTPDGLPRTAFPVRRHRPLGDLSADGAEPTARAGGWSWRRGWDSNPRCSSHTAFRERHLKPLGHLSAAESTKRDRAADRRARQAVAASLAEAARLGLADAGRRPTADAAARGSRASWLTVPARTAPLVRAPRRRGRGPASRAARRRTSGTVRGS